MLLSKLRKSQFRKISIGNPSDLSNHDRCFFKKKENISRAKYIKHFSSFLSFFRYKINKISCKKGGQ